MFIKKYYNIVRPKKISGYYRHLYKGKRSFPDREQLVIPLKMHRIIIIILLLLSADLFAQNEKIILSGIIKNDSLPIGNVQVINLSTRRGSLSNSKGEFRITARLNDTLAFSDIQYKYKQIRVNKEQIRSKFLTVKLELNVNKLDEVVIFKNKELTNPLGLPNFGKKPLDKIEREINYYSQESLGKIILQTLLFKAGGINDLYYVVSGERKKFRKYKNLLDHDKLVEFQEKKAIEIREHFKDDFFIEHFSIPKEKINDFILYCIPDEMISLFDQKRYIEVIDIFYKKKDAFLKTLQEDFKS